MVVKLEGAWNGKRLPNWLYLAIALALFAFNAGVTWSAKEQGVKDVDVKLQQYAKDDSIQTFNLIRELDRREERRNREVNEELREIGKRVGHIARAIQ
jgi:hypothetical protein